MGWKASTIIVQHAGEVNYEHLLCELGLSNCKKIGDESFEVTVHPDANKIYLGRYKDSLLICEESMPMQFFEEENPKVEKTLVRLFPQSEICAIVLHSTVNLWGYAVTKNGQRIRTRAGASEGGTFVDMGEPLEEEKELLSKSTLNEDGSRTYLLEEFPDEPFEEDQVGENFVFEICRRYFGEPLDRADNLLFETKLSGYSFSGIATGKSSTSTSEHSATEAAKKDSKPWWKFW